MNNEPCERCEESIKHHLGQNPSPSNDPIHEARCGNACVLINSFSIYSGHAMQVHAYAVQCYGSLYRLPDDLLAELQTHMVQAAAFLQQARDLLKEKRTARAAEEVRH